jgi:hypothetical protein
MAKQYHFSHTRKNKKLIENNHCWYYTYERPNSTVYHAASATLYINVIGNILPLALPSDITHERTSAATTSNEFNNQIIP